MAMAVVGGILGTVPCNSLPDDAFLQKVYRRGALKFEVYDTFTVSR